MEELFGARLRALRKKRGLSASKFARECLISRQFLRMVEDGKSFPTWPVCVRMACVLKIKLERLRETKGEVIDL